MPMSPRSPSSSGRSATSPNSSRARPTVRRTCGACSATGRRPVSPPSCTRRRADTPTTGPRCYGLADKAKGAGVRILTGVEVKGFGFGANSKAVTSVETDQGSIGVDQVVVAPAPGCRASGTCSTCPDRIDVKDLKGTLHADVDMWRFWCLQEGHARRRALLRHGRRRVDAAGHPRRFRRTALFRRGRQADHRRDVGHLLQARLQLRRHPGRCRPLQGGDPGARRGDRPLRAGIAGIRRRRRVQGDVVLGAGLCQSRYKGQIGRWLDEPSGGIGAFTRRQLPRVRHASARTAT